MWNSVFVLLPNNNALVWIRVLNIYGPPVQATFKSSTQVFTTVVSKVQIPVYICARWKAV